MFSIIQAAGWPIWPLIFCSVIALALVIERFVSLKAAKVLPPQLLEEAIMVSRNGVPNPDVVTQLEQNSVFGEVLASGFRTLNNNPRATEDDLRSSLEGAGRIAGSRLQRYLGALATIASAAPLLGLLGTVIGMMHLFLGILDHGVGDVAQLAGGIGQALVTTASGMCVAIPALVFHRYFRGLVGAYVIEMEREAIALVDTLDGIAAPKPAPAPTPASAPGAPARRRSSAG